MPNLIEFEVTEVANEPQHQDLGELGDVWTLDVMATSYGRESLMTLTFQSEEEALDVEPGHTFDRMA